MNKKSFLPKDDEAFDNLLRKVLFQTGRINPQTLEDFDKIIEDANLDEEDEEHIERIINKLRNKYKKK